MESSADSYRHRGMRKKLVDLLRGRDITSTPVLDAIGEVPRHLFLDDTALLDMAYTDQALPIACGQTISQPYTVAFQSQLLQVRPGQKVLEIGTGSGYQCAVLCAMGAKVFSIERHRALFLRTRERLTRLQYKARLYYGDGYKGIEPQAPFDRIIVTCGAPHVPEALLAQLKVGGIMVIPVGEGSDQTMWTMERKSPEEYERTSHGTFRFVPMLEQRTAG